ncbi:allophanate hydrolase [Friedmanniella luteola]|uniref:Allophanate hydrolase n=1 Tax=Friedmanniella luteola TaxID=546871 RepID=A0A1H1ZJW9_9ACTN|nr:allophanate hydrolase [Friedmanniella luteola]SDT33752.1 allophanate hydrolase [Friedmanniella luteola]
MGMTAAPAAETGTGPSIGPTVAALLGDHRSGRSTPTETLRRTLDLVEARGSDGTWITVVDRPTALARAAALEADAEARLLPLYGVPFGVKDSIDVAGWPTTLACPAYAYTATTTAPVVQRLLDAGAVLVGKTNLDQFATGLNGTRTPYPVPRSVYGGDLISGGSSSGSAVAVAVGEVPFAVATDTAGSGRVPPALNGVLGFKPSRGLLSTVGLVPACRSLDCISLIGTAVEDLRTVFGVMVGLDERDPWTRPRVRWTSSVEDLVVGLPDPAELSFFGDAPMAAAHHAARARVQELFGTSTPSLQPFLQAGELLYSGPWVAERLVEFGDFLAEHPDDVLPVVGQIISGGGRFSAADVFRAQYRLAELRAVVARVFTRTDVLVLPTVGTTFTVPEVLADPVTTNTVLGHYTHFANLLDLCAVAVPAGLTADGRPASLMVLGPALSDDQVLAVAARIALTD